jgi:hypothetical protein
VRFGGGLGAQKQGHEQALIGSPRYKARFPAHAGEFFCGSELAENVTADIRLGNLALGDTQTDKQMYETLSVRE